MGISPFQLGIILLIVILVFGTKKLRNMGGDLGGAIKNFKKGIRDDDEPQSDENTAEIADNSANQTKASADKTSNKES